MIGFSIMMWFVSIILVLLGGSLLKGNYAGMHGKVFNTTNDKVGYARSVGKPVLLIGIGIAISGIMAIVIQQDSSIFIAVGLMLTVIAIGGIWFRKIQKRFS